MDRTVYFADKAVIFTCREPAAPCRVLTAAADGGITRTKICKILETDNCVAVLSDDPDRAFAAFAADFVQVEAAGGIAVNERGEWLMMRRNGRWDLPKGHLEPGETLARCAERETEEETGVLTHAVRPLCRTLHAYYFPKTARWELKRTHWFELRAEGGAPKPQTEEGIECVAWCRPDRIAEHLRDAFPTIRCVARAMRER